MSIWAEIKKALNSTLGTSYHKPLDELIFRGKTFVASEQETLYDFDIGEVRLNVVDSIFEVPQRIRFYNGGTVNFRVWASERSLSDTTGYTSMVVYKNGVEVGSARNNTLDAAWLTLPIVISPYDVYSVKLENGIK